jgi:hypothetical protein
MLVWPEEVGYLYSILYIVQLTKTLILARDFILIIIAYNDEIAQPRTFYTECFLLKIQNKMFCI